MDSVCPQLEDVELLKKRIDSAAETIANGVQPRSKEEAMSQYVSPIHPFTVLPYPFTNFISSIVHPYIDD